MRFDMNSVTISSEDLPGLYRTADSISEASQKEYFRLALGYLAFLFFGSILAFLTAFWPASKSIAIASAVSFLGSLLLILFIYFQRPETAWYSARAVAESVKTRAWRWMMRAEPYTEREKIEQARIELISDMRTILDQNREMANRIGGEHCTGEAITRLMETIRAMKFSERFEVYKSARIDDQLDWYQRKTLWNRRRSKQWLSVSIGLNACAIILLLIKIAEPAHIVPVEIVAFLAGAALTWTQMKKFRELATSYGLTAHEITLIKGEAANVSDELQFSEFVLNSENAFSREHTQWVARKE
jgi:ABC-type multidrug transport system fused ATPase/permease subunit